MNKSFSNDSSELPIICFYHFHIWASLFSQKITVIIHHLLELISNGVGVEAAPAIFALKSSRFKKQSTGTSLGIDETLPERSPHSSAHNPPWESLRIVALISCRWSFPSLCFAVLSEPRLSLTVSDNWNSKTTAFAHAMRSCFTLCFSSNKIPTRNDSADRNQIQFGLHAHSDWAVPKLQLLLSGMLFAFCVSDFCFCVEAATHPSPSKRKRVYTMTIEVIPNTVTNVQVKQPQWQLTERQWLPAIIHRHGTCGSGTQCCSLFFLLTRGVGTSLCSKVRCRVTFELVSCTCQHSPSYSPTHGPATIYGLSVVLL